VSLFLTSHLTLLNYIKCLNNNSYLGFNDWRLPNRKELRSLIDHSNYLLALSSGHPFVNVKSGEYWTSTSIARRTDDAWYVHMGYGLVGYGYKSAYYYNFVWPVRAGQVNYLLTTTWNQRRPYTVWYDSNNNGTAEEYLVGCNAVAIGQLINYYFQKGYRNGWLEIMLQDVTVYPRFWRKGEFFWDKQELYLNGYETKISYVNSIANLDSPGANDLREFLWYVALGLDSLFIENEETSAGGWYFTEIWRYFTKPDKLITLLIDRFRFKNMIIVSSGLERINEEKIYIKDSIDKGLPVLVTMKGVNNKTKEPVGHAAIIDGYRDTPENGFQVHINMGWGNRNNTNAFYNTNGRITAGNTTFSRFSIYKNTQPINFN